MLVKWRLAVAALLATAAVNAAPQQLPDVLGVILAPVDVGLNALETLGKVALAPVQGLVDGLSQPPPPNNGGQAVAVPGQPSHNQQPVAGGESSCVRDCIFNFWPPTGSGLGPDANPPAGWPVSGGGGSSSSSTQIRPASGGNTSPGGGSAWIKIGDPESSEENSSEEEFQNSPLIDGWGPDDNSGEENGGTSSEEVVENVLGGGGGSSGWEVASTTRQPNRVEMTSSGRPDLRDCGRVEDVDTSQKIVQIVGGVAAAKGRWPFAVAIGEPEGDGNFVATCGGTLISWDTVLTAAHCFPKGGSPAKTVRVGDTDIGSAADGIGEDLVIKSTIFHPGWNSATLDNDICLLKLMRPAHKSRWVQLACLPTSYKDRDLASLLSQDDPTIIGWGATQSGGFVVSQLQENQVPLVRNGKCQELYSAVGNSIIDENKLCAGDGKNDTCQGDSGGPLLTNNIQGLWSVLGVTSYGIGCGGDIPGVYTRVDKYINWILANL